MFLNMKVKFSILFSIIMVFILGRLYLYFDVKSLNLLYSSVTMTTVLPFYITEITMALFLCYILFQVNKMDRNSALNVIYTESFIEGDN
jgi:biotin transporter BioY